MKFRTIDIPMVVYQILRSNYAVRRDTVDGRVVLSLNNLYKFIVCCLYDIKEFFAGYEAARARAYMIASCMPIIGQATLVLNHLFGQHGAIRIGQPMVAQVYLWDEQSATPANQVYLYTDDQNNPTYLGYSGAAGNSFAITVPQALVDDTALYSEFKAALYCLVMWGLNYEIEVY